ncbi:MAG: fibronectin type III domain-containing protein, partial [Dehalococcoidia bacterium]|nr:fibronectin type III domain-containing protein [Dehalococcoidia bacterium]
MRGLITKASFFNYIIIFSLLLPFAIFLSPTSVEADYPSCDNCTSGLCVSEDGRIVFHGIFTNVLSEEPFTRQEYVAPSSPSVEGVDTFLDVPRFLWNYGCVPTSAGMVFGYYDQPIPPWQNFTNIYTGQTNNGVCPMEDSDIITNSRWHRSDNISGLGECPFSASHMGIDGRTIKGHVDDYWISYNDPGPDPYQIGQWYEHSADSLADFMGTSQAKYSHKDGLTDVYWYPNGDPMYMWDQTLINPDILLGLRKFTEYRNYKPILHYCQSIQGRSTDPSKGFTFDNYTTEIDQHHPVFIIVGKPHPGVDFAFDDLHCMVGIGYINTATEKTIKCYSTFERAYRTMPWGGNAEQILPLTNEWVHCAVAVLHIANSPVAPTISNYPAAKILSPNWARPYCTLLDGGANCTIYLYWGTNPNYLNSVSLGTKIAPGMYYYDLTGLSPNTTYYFKYYAVNSAGSYMAAVSSFTTPGSTATVPTITNGSGATNIISTSATLNGNLTSDGNATTSVTVYWGTTDGGITASNWAHYVPLGAIPVGPFSTNIPGLAQGT